LGGEESVLGADNTFWRRKKQGTVDQRDLRGVKNGRGIEDAVMWSVKPNRPEGKKKGPTKKHSRRKS